MRFLSQWVRPKDGKTSLRRAPVAGRSRRPGRCLLVEALEPRRLLSLTLTAAGLADGFGLSTFATGFPSSGSIGPLGVAFPDTGGVLVSDYPGNLRLFPTDTDGQNAASITPINNFGGSNALGLGQLDGNLYLSQQAAGDVVQLINNGASTQVVVSGIPGATALLADPFNNLLYVNGGSGAIYAVDPVAKTANVFQNIAADGLSLSPDGTTLYAAIRGGAFGSHVLGFDITTKATVFDSGAISGGVDGIALGYGPVAGNLFVNTNGGTIVEVNLATAAQTLIASGGSRGDFVAVDPNDATLLVTQSDRIMRLVPGVFGIPRLSTITALTASTASAATRPVGHVHRDRQRPVRRAGPLRTAERSPSATRTERSAASRWRTAWRRSQPRAWRRARTPSRPLTAARRTSPQHHGHDRDRRRQRHRRLHRRRRARDRRRAGLSTGASPSTPRATCSSPTGSNNVVREVVKATGDIITVAGNGTAGYSGDGGPATAAELNGANSVAVDSAGDLFIADTGQQRDPRGGQGDRRHHHHRRQRHRRLQRRRRARDRRRAGQPPGPRRRLRGRRVLRRRPQQRDPRGGQGDRRHHHRRRQRHGGLQRRRRARDCRRAERPHQRGRRLRRRPVHRRREQQRGPRGRQGDRRHHHRRRQRHRRLQRRRRTRDRRRAERSRRPRRRLRGRPVHRRRGQQRGPRGASRRPATSSPSPATAPPATAATAGPRPPPSWTPRAASPSIPRATCSSPTLATMWSARSRRR